MAEPGRPGATVKWLPSGGFVVAFDYHPGRTKAIKTVPGRAWNKDRKWWTIPATAPAAAKLASWVESWGAEVSEAARAQLVELAEAGNLLVATSAAIDAPFEIEGLKLDPFGYQRAAALYGIHARRCWFADPMGLGKTIEAIITCQAAGAYPVVVIAPMKVRTNWCLEWLAWIARSIRVGVVVPPSTSRRDIGRLSRRGIYVMVGKVHQGIELDVVVVAYPSLTPEVTAGLVALGPRALVVDESHYVKTHEQVKLCAECGAGLNRGLKSCKAGHETKRPEQRIIRYKVERTHAVWEVSRAVPPDGLVLLLSGTPNKNHTEDFVAQLDVLGRLEEFGGRHRFFVRYCAAYRDRWGWHYDGSSNLDELNERLRASCFVRRSRAEVQPDLPPILRTKTVLDLDDATLADYYRAEDDVAGFLADRAATLAAESGESIETARWKARLKAEAGEHLVRITTLLKLAALPRSRRRASGSRTFWPSRTANCWCSPTTTTSFTPSSADSGARRSRARRHRPRSSRSRRRSKARVGPGCWWWGSWPAASG